MKSDYRGYLVKFGGTQMPNSFFNAYKSTPNQRTEMEAWRDNTNYLQRVTSPNFKTTLNLSVRSLTAEERDLFEAIKSNGLLDRDQRKYQVEYWNLEELCYTSGEFYIPDTEYEIPHISDNEAGEMFYAEFTLEMIQY